MNKFLKLILVLTILVLAKSTFAASTFFVPLNHKAPAYTIKVTLTNGTGSPTGVNFHQLIRMNSNTNSTKYATNLANVNWQDGNGHILPSWLESGETNTSTASTYLINLGTNSFTTSLSIYQVIYDKNIVAIDGTTTGAEPNYSGTYGQYDNGANVFTQYGGKSWSSFTNVNGAWDTTNGYLEQTSSASGTVGPASLIESTGYSVTGSYILEMAFSYTGSSVARVGIMANASPSGGDVFGYRFIGEQTSDGAGFLSFLNDTILWVSNGSYGGSTSTPYTMQIQNSGGNWSGNLFAGYGISGSTLSSLGSTSYTAANSVGSTSGYVGISAAVYTGSVYYANPIKVQWFRMRALPPASTMPSTTIFTATANTNKGFVHTPW